MSTTFWIKTLELILALGILVMIHEFGHYFFARIFGVWVEKFYLFFNPWLSLVKWKPGKYLKWLSHGNEMGAMENDEGKSENKDSWKATEYGIGWLPLGGYCAISGMVDESMNTDKLKEPAKPWEFRSKAAWKRLLIMLGGVLFNFLLAIVIYAGIVYTQGEQFIKFTDATEGMVYSDCAHKAGFQDGDIPLTADGKELEYLNNDVFTTLLNAKVVTVLRNHQDTVKINLPSDFLRQVNLDAQAGQSLIDYRLPVVVSQTQPRTSAEKIGLQEGDHLTAVNGVPTPEYFSFKAELEKNKGKAITLQYERNGQVMTATNVPIESNGQLGFLLTPLPKIYKTTTVSYNLLQSIPRGFVLGWSQMVNYVKQLKVLFTPEGAQSLGGFGTIGSIFPDTWNWVDFWSITAFISIILAVMNVLPIPALDGGHVMFLLYEMVTGRQPSVKFLEKAQYVGMALLLALLLFANGNDIYRFFFK